MTPQEGTAKSRYDDLEPLRAPYLRRARKCSKFTLPTLIPPLGWNGTMELPEPWNNIGARGVNNLSSKLLLTLFPPGSACFRNELDPTARLQIEQRFGQDKEGFAAWMAAADSAMAEIEKRFVTWTEANQHRVSLGEVFKHLIVGGNVLLYTPETGGLRVLHLDKFVVLRDCYGKLLEIVVKECVAKAALDPDAAKVLEEAPVADMDKKEDGGDSRDPQARKSAAKTVDLYTHIYWTGRTYRVYQEIVGRVIPKSRGSYPEDKMPWLPLRWTKIDGEDYGWSHVDACLGDLATLDMLSQAVAEGAAAAARIIYLKQPGKVGKTQDVIDAPNGGVVVMEHDALKALQLEKHYDFNTAQTRLQELEKSISFSFLLNTAIQRSGERVTAEEIRYMAQELEDALGGVYSILAQELQLPYVRRNLFVMMKRKAIPSLSDKDIKPVIITGLDALGRGNDLNRLDTFIGGVAQALGPETVATAINADEYMRRRAIALGVDPQGLIKTPDEIAQAQQAQQMQAMIAKLGPNAVNQMGGIAQAHLNNQSKERQAAQDAQQQQQQQQADASGGQ